jgi:hypothetical protein
VAAWGYRYLTSHELPRRVLLGKWASGIVNSRKPGFRHGLLYSPRCREELSEKGFNIESGTSVLGSTVTKYGLF